MTVKKTPISEVIKILGLSENTKFCGYVVHLPKEDEFLVYLKEDENITQRSFSKMPGCAKVYKNYKKALRDAKSCRQVAEPWLLFDDGNQYYAAKIE